MIFIADAAGVANAISTTAVLVLVVINVIFIICLIIAPLMIWHHVKGMRGELRDLATQIRFDQAKISADVKQIRTTLANPDLGVDCPSCGKRVQPNGNGTGKCDGCGQMFRVER